MLDPLTDVLATLRMRGTLYFRTDFRAPWGVSVPERRLVARFHLLIRGEAWVEVDATRVRMQRGDLVLVPHGAFHTLRDQPDRPYESVDDVLDETAYDGTSDLRYGGDGESTVLVCGHFGFDDELLHPVLETLPAVVHLRAAEGHDFTWLDGATRAIAVETATRAPGWEAVVDRVSAILFIQALRASLSEPSAAAVVAAFADPQIGRALVAVHEDPAYPWSLQDLARLARMSRTVFADRFRACMGLTPMAYVTRWRLQRARRHLLDSDDIVAAVAERAGYSSEAAFCRAFRRLYGKPPATYRRERGHVAA